MIHSRIGFGLLLAILTLQDGALRISPLQTPSKQTRPGCPTPGEPVPPIAPGRPVGCELKSGEEHAFRISLRAGEFLQARVEQRGVDAFVTLVDPAGKILLRMDSPNGGEGEEPVLAPADRAGEHRLIVTGMGKGWSGSYRLSILQPRPASRVDRVRAEALRKMAEGDLPASLQAWESVQDSWGQILVLERLALLLSDQQRYKEALDVCSKGTVLARDQGDLIAENRFTNLAGLAHRELEEREKARDLFESALELAEQGGDATGKGLALNNLGLVAEDQGNLQQALDRYGAALEIWEREVNDPGQHANTLANLGEIYLSMGEPSEALRSFNDALNLVKRVDQRDVQYAIVDGAGLALHDLGLPKKALWNYRLALGLASKPYQRARTLYRLGLVYSEEEDFLKASKAFEQALQLALSERDRRYEAYVLAELAHIDHLQGRKLEAFRKFDRARVLFEEMEDQRYVASSLFGRAEVERDLGRPEDALASVTRSVEIVESLRADVIEPRLRVSFFASRHRFYELYVDLLMELQRPEQAFEINERARARTLLDDVAGRGRPATEAMSLRQIQRELLDSNSLLLVYSLGPLRSHLWAVRRDSIETFKLPSRTKVEAQALEVWRGLSTKDNEDDVALLSRTLLPPELDLQPGTRLLVSADGVLNLIPFAALQGADGRRLVFNHTVAYEPSASVLVGMRRNLRFRPPAPKAIALFADAIFERDDIRFKGARAPLREGGGSRSPGTGELRRLPASRREAVAIRKLVPERDRFEALDFSANRSAVLNPALSQYRGLHFGTHHLSGADPEHTGLVLSLFDEQGRPIAGLLKTTEVYNLRFPAELVVLSACGTGLGKNVPGEGTVGLTRAFFHAGARRVVVSLWDVEDGATAELMTRFYRGMFQDGLSPSEALRSAQESMAAEPRWSDPRHWAAFVLQGEPD
ncbi:MAG TPA: CHAT domain-containing tetratricopeptide repeat protein [Thermoanaerobaculia bacterium]|nr:CHAT domain-containing tetratricopeptide repeat protein [Thermoanaerobaculia bacterium]